MGVYARPIGPRLVPGLCCMGKITAEREKVVPYARGTVVEIGMGPGLNLPFYDPTQVERVIGVDPSEHFVRLGRERVKASPVPVTAIRAPAEEMPLDDASADTVVVTYTLCSVQDPAKALSETRRILKPGGKVLFLEHGLAGDASVARWQNRLNPVWHRIAVGCNRNRPIAHLLEGAGFRITKLHHFYLPATPYPVGLHSRGMAARPL